MTSLLLWLAIGVLLGIIELVSTTFVLLWIAIAAVATGVLGLVLPNLVYQTVAFVLFSVGLLFASRPLVRKWRNAKSAYATEADEMMGRQGVVISRLEGGKSGLVRVGNDVWSARASELGSVLEAGAWVRVVEVKSSTLVVMGISQQQS